MQHNKTKVSLSKDEYDLVNNAQILLTKNEIIGKVYSMFGKLSEQYVEEVKNNLPPDVIKKSPKISRGENYEGLPYVMLDYPRHFLQEDTFAIRTFFWWGNFFSITIQLSGKFYQQLLPKLQGAAERKLLNNWFVGVNENKWLHHFRETNYASIGADDLMKTLHQEDTIKMAKKIPLTEWDDVSIFLEENFKLLISIIKS